MRAWLTVLLVAAAAAGCASAPPELPASGGRVELEVRVVGLADDAGEVAVALYDRADGFGDRDRAVATAWLTPADRVAVWRVGPVEAGRYAVAAFHDRDGDRRLGRSALGPPTEPYGFSNDARSTFGPPSFGAAAVDLAAGARVVAVTVR